MATVAGVRDAVLCCVRSGSGIVLAVLRPDAVRGLLVGEIVQVRDEAFGGVQNGVVQELLSIGHGLGVVGGLQTDLFPVGP